MANVHYSRSIEGGVGKCLPILCAVSLKLQSFVIDRLRLILVDTFTVKHARFIIVKDCPSIGVSKPQQIIRNGSKVTFNVCLNHGGYGL